jgi:Flp pilus assembly protein TadB
MQDEARRQPRRVDDPTFEVRTLVVDLDLVREKRRAVEGEERDVDALPDGEVGLGGGPVMIAVVAAVAAVIVVAAVVIVVVAAAAMIVATMIVPADVVRPRDARRRRRDGDRRADRRGARTPSRHSTPR